MLLKLSSVDDSISDMALGMKGKDHDGLIGILNSLKDEGKDASDIGKALNLAGFSKDAAQAAIRASDLSQSANTVVTGFDAMATATTGLKGKFNTIKDGASKLGTTLKTKVVNGAKSARSMLGKLGTVIKAHPLISATAGVAGVGLIAYQAYKMRKEARFQETSQNADAWESKDKSIEEQITQYTSLKKQLDAGTASAQEEYNIRQQILEIQREITNLYGDQVGNLDLANGKLEEQQKKLEAIRAQEAKDFLTNNDTGIITNSVRDSKKAMEKKKNYHIADNVIKGTKQYQLLGKAIRQANEELEKQGFKSNTLKLEKNNSDGTYALDYKGTVEKNKIVQNALKDQIEKIADETDTSDLFEGIINNIDENIRSSNKTIDKYGDMYEQVREATLLSDKHQYGKDDNKKLASEWLSDYEDVVNEYNDSFATGTQETIDSAKQKYDDFYKSLPKDLRKKYKPEIDEITDALDSDSINKNDYVQALKGTDKYSKSFSKTAQALKDLNLSESDIYSILNSSDADNSVIKGRILALKHFAKEMGVIEDETSSESVEKFIQALSDADIVSASNNIDTSALSVEQLEKKVSAAQTALSNINSVISASNSDSGLLTENISAIEESFGKLDSYNAGAIFSKTADGIKLNTSALQRLIDQQHKADSDDLEARIKGQNEELQKQRDILNDSTKTDSEKNNAKEQINSITEAIERMKEAQSQLYASYKQQMELTSDYQAVINAESTPNAGARYDNMKSKVKTAKEAYDKGEIGTDDFKTVARYLSPNGFEDPDNFIENYQKAKRYLTDDSSGIFNFLNDLKSKGLATMTTLSDGTQEWSTTFDDAAEASRQAGMGYEFFMDMFGKAEDYGAFNTLISSAEEGELKVEDLTKQLADAKTRMAELQAQGADKSSIEGQQQVIDDLTSKLGQAQGALDDYYGSFNQRQSQQLENVKKQLDLMSDQIKNTADQNLRDYLISNFKSLAKQYGLDYNYDEGSDTISVDKESYKDKMSEYGNTWVNPSSAEDMGYKEGTQEAKDYQTAVDSLTKAHEQNDAATEDAFKTLSQYNAEELKGIELGNKKYDSDDEGLRKAEDALQMLSDKYGLTKEQLLSGLKGLGQLKPEIDTEGIEKAKEEAQQAKDALHEMQESGVIGKDVDLDTSLVDKTKDQLSSEKESLESTLKLNPELDQSKIDTIQNEIERRDIQLKIRERLEPTDGGDKFTLEQLQSMTQQEAIEKVGIDTDYASFQEFKAQLDALEAEAADVPVNIRIDDDQLNAIIEALGGKPIEKDVEVKAEGDVDKVNSIIDAPPAKQMNFEVSSNMSSSQALMDMFGETEVKKSIDIETGGDINEINNIFSYLNGTPVEVIMSWVEKGMTLDDIIKKANGEDVEIPVEYEDPKAIDPSNFDPVDIKARITDIDKSNTIPTVMDATANITNTQGADGQQVNIDASANITETTGADGQQVSIDATADIVDTQGAENQSVDIQANATGVEEVDQLKTSVDSVESKKVKTEAKAIGEPQVKSLKGSIDSVQSKNVTVTALTHGAAQIVSLRDSINALHDKTITVTTNKVETQAPKASGTMTSVAHADGTAYNVLNLKPLSSAHAGGNVGLPNNEVALTNEIGTESIVRDGVWSLLPGGPHFESLKKGDIIFSASQTKALLEHGKTFGHARAYANGTLDMLPAHAYPKRTTGGLNFNTKYVKGTNSSGNNNSNSDTTPKTTTGGGGGGGTKSNSFSDPWKNVKDWFERVVTKLQNLIDINKARADNEYNVSTKNKYTQNSIDNTERLISNYKKAEKMYTKKANQYAKTIGLSKSLQKKVQNGTVNIEKLSEANKQKVEAYQTWYDKINNCKSAIEDLKAKEKELYQQKLDNITERYDAVKSVYENEGSFYASKNDYRTEIGSSQKIGKENKIDSSNSDYYNNLIRQKNSQDMQTYYIQKEMNEYKTEMKKIYDKYGANSTIYKQAEATYKELAASLYDSKKAAAELKNQMDELAITLKKYDADKFNRALEKESAYRDFKKNNNYSGSYGYGELTEQDYLTSINHSYDYIDTLRAEKEKVQKKMLTLDKTDPKYQEYADQIADFDKEILSTGNNIAELKKDLVEVKFDAFNDAQDNLDNVISDLSDLQDMLDSDTFMNEDGSFTKQGLASLTLMNQEIDAQMQKITDYEQHLKDLQALLDGGWITQEEYDQQRLDAIDKINSASKSLYSSQQNLIKLYEDQITKENEYLQDNISLRQNALDAKKDYYDYNKTLKDKNKDINALKAQIAALEGTTNAAAKAKLEKLKADLKDKEDDLADTKYEHQIDMESKGYDDLADQADDVLDKTLNAVKSNADLQKSIIDNMLSDVKKSYKDAFGEIEEIIKETGYHTSDWFNQYVNKDNTPNNNSLKDKKPGDYTGADGKGGSTYTGDDAPKPSSGAQIGINGAIDDAKDGTDNVGKIYNSKTGKYEDAQTLDEITVNGKSKTTVRVAVGQSQAVKIGYTKNTTVKKYTTEVSNSGVVSLKQATDTLTVTGKKSGKTTITVKGTYVNCKTATISVIVEPKKYDDYLKKVASVASKQKLKLSDDELVKMTDNLTIGKSSKQLSDKELNKSILKAVVNEKATREKKKQEALDKAEQSKNVQKITDAYNAWYKGLKTKKYSKDEISKASTLSQHYMNKQKQVTDAQYVQLANSVFGLKYPKDKSKWTGTQKKNLLSTIKSYGFAKGGIVRNLIPADMNSLIGNAIIKNGDTGFITARAGETVLTEEFTKQLKPTVQTMNAFTEMMQNGSGVKNLSAMQSPEINYSPEININVDSIDNDIDINNLGKQLTDVMFDNFSKRLSKDWKKVTGRNR